MVEITSRYSIIFLKLGVFVFTLWTIENSIQMEKGKISRLISIGENSERGVTKRKVLLNSV